ncbi:MAG: urea amidolyase associated protein UAAP1 [Gammaproteobacteria bacterium]
MTAILPQAPPGPLLWTEELHDGAHRSFLMRRGTSLRLTDLEGAANCSALFFNADCMLERYNMPDTLKAQHVAYLTSGRVCYSDMGRILVSITGDSCGWHDTICGLSTAADLERRWGRRRFQEHRNEMHRDALSGVLVELAKWGLGRRDLGASVNFFSKAWADGDGRLNFVPGNSRPGDHVDLRAEMNLLVVLSGAPHPLDAAPEYRPRRLHLALWRSPPANEFDPCRVSCPENARGFVNTERFFAQ